MATKKYGKGGPGLARQEVTREKMIHLHISIPEAVAEGITKEALRLRLSRSRLITEILQGYLNLIRGGEESE